jgi:hypothetical protein
MQEGQILSLSCTLLNQSSRICDSSLNNRAISSIFGEAGQDELCSLWLPPILERWDVERIIVGHNPQESRRVRVRCNGRIVLADVGISKWIFNDDGNPMAIVQANGGKLEAIYLNHVDILT